MLTVHCLWNKIGDEVQRACSALHINKNHMRVVRMGKGVIVLEDTNRAEPCGEKEVLKALGIVKTADKRSVSISVGSAEAEKQNRKTVFPKGGACLHNINNDLRKAHDGSQLNRTVQLDDLNGLLL